MEAHVTEDTAETIGVQPSAAAALASKQALAQSTLESTIALLDGLVLETKASFQDLARSYRAVWRLQSLLSTLMHKYLDPEPAVEPCFYEWYFRAIGYLQRQDWEGLRAHAHRLPALAVIPLARAGLLSEQHGGPLEVDIPPGGALILSERESVDPLPPVAAPTAKLSVRGDMLVIAPSAQPSFEIDWRALDSYGRYQIPNHPTSFWQTGFASRRVVEDYQRDLSTVYGNASPFHLISPQEFEGEHHYDIYSGRFGAGLDLISRCWPELYDEICILTNYFAVIRGEPFVGGSAISCFGTSFFNLRPEWSDVSFADHIVHEAAHQRLHVEFELQPALINGDYLGAASPIRRDPRPLYGVLHATFVFLRLSLFLERVVRTEYSLEADKRLHRHALGLYHGVKQLEKYARWNPRGEYLFSEIRGEANRLKSIVPQPKPEYYNDIGPDYEPVSALAAAYHD
jgi:HEXXH motif-containing protein